jgi:hypothetical protein
LSLISTAPIYQPTNTHNDLAMTSKAMTSSLEPSSVTESIYGDPLQKTVRDLETLTDARGHDFGRRAEHQYKTRQSFVQAKIHT